MATKALGEETRFINFRVAVPPSTYMRLRADSPVTGRITHALFHFPAGCLSLVGIKVLLEGVEVWPIRGQIALDDATPVYAFPSPGQALKKNAHLDVEIENTDTTYPHTPSVLLTVVGVL